MGAFLGADRINPREYFIFSLIIVSNVLKSALEVSGLETVSKAVRGVPDQSKEANPLPCLRLFP